MTPIFFAYFALVSIVAGVLTVALRNPVHCGIALLALLGHIAGLFVLLHAEFLAVVQIIIYAGAILIDRKSTRLNSSHGYISYAVFCLKKKKKEMIVNSA